MKLLTFMKDSQHGLAASDGGDFHGSTNMGTTPTDLLLLIPSLSSSPPSCGTTMDTGDTI